MPLPQIFCLHGGLSPTLDTLDHMRALDRVQEVRFVRTKTLALSLAVLSSSVSVHRSFSQSLCNTSEILQTWVCRSGGTRLLRVSCDSWCTRAPLTLTLCRRLP